jgi:hypothetical protein
MGKVIIASMIKTLTLISIAVLFFACSSKRHASSVNSMKTGKYTKLKHFDGDTLQYVTRNFVNRKDKYIGKKLKELLKDVELPILYYNFGSSFRGSKKIPYLSLFFFSKTEVWKKMDEPISTSNIIIEWSNGGLPEDQVFNLGRRNKGNWDLEAIDYYGDQIIADILTSSSGQSGDFVNRQQMIGEQVLKAYGTANLDAAMPKVSKTNIKSYPTCFIENIDDVRPVNFKTSADCGTALITQHGKPEFYAAQNFNGDYNIHQIDDKDDGFVGLILAAEKYGTNPFFIHFLKVSVNERNIMAV